MGGLAGKIAIVIGASRGIGAASGAALADAGATVCLAAPAPETCEPIVESIRADGGQAEAFDCDVSDSAQVENLVDSIHRKHGQIDILINCAGVMGPVAMLEDCDPDAWLRCIKINLTGAFNACRAVLPHLRRRNTGVIVNMSTGAAFNALQGWSAYSSSKAGLAMLSQIIAAEVQGTEIRMYSFQPGMVNTKLGQQSMKVDINKVTNLDPNSFSSPAEPAQAITWLCSEDAADLAGQEVVITDPDFRRRAGLQSIN